jgi:hypothetical protein
MFFFAQSGGVAQHLVHTTRINEKSCLDDPDLLLYLSRAATALSG